MQVDINGVHTYNHDLCSTCVKNNNECVFKKALSNYHGGGYMPLMLRLTGCPEYIRTENRNDEISLGSF